VALAAKGACGSRSSIGGVAKISELDGKYGTLWARAPGCADVSPPHPPAAVATPSWQHFDWRPNKDAELFSEMAVFLLSAQGGGVKGKLKGVVRQSRFAARHG